jgi:putative spermidine/putrescine transport system permease protein
VGELEAGLSDAAPAGGAGFGPPAAWIVRPMRVDRHALLVLPAAALMAVCFAWPVLHLLADSFTQPTTGLGNYHALLEHRLFRRVLWNTVVISGSVDLLCALIAYPVAYTMANARPSLRRLLIFVVLIPFWSSVLVRSFAWMVLLQRNGLVIDILIGIGLLHAPAQLIYNRVGVLIGMVQILLPFMIFPLYTTMSRIDPSYAQAAATLGAPPVRGFLRVYLPLTLPGLVTGGVLVFVIALGYYIVPALLGGIGDAMVAQVIEAQVADFGNWGLAGALSAVLLCGTMLTLGLVLHGYARRSAWRQ